MARSQCPHEHYAPTPSLTGQLPPTCYAQESNPCTTDAVACGAGDVAAGRPNCGAGASNPVTEFGKLVVARRSIRTSGASLQQPEIGLQPHMAEADPFPTPKMMSPESTPTHLISTLRRMCTVSRKKCSSGARRVSRQEILGKNTGQELDNFSTHARKLLPAALLEDVPHASRQIRTNWSKIRPH